MASQTQSLNRDNPFGFPFNGKLTIKPNVQEREFLGKKNDGGTKPRRRPLQELNCKNLENLTNPVKAVDKAASKHNQDKVKKNGGRKALGDLTNSSKLVQRVGVKNDSTLKLPSVAEEGFLHDHQECTKLAQRQAAMDKDFFLETVGFGKDCSTPIGTLKAKTSSSSKLESPPARLEFDYRGTLSPTASPKLESPVRRNLDQDVDMLQLGIEWDALDFVCGFKMDSPSK